MRKPHSFDVFDTLIARRCVEPRNIFQEVEKKARFAGFAELRLKAEAAVKSQPYTLDDVYNYFASHLGVSQDACKNLWDSEIELEIDNAIPILENLEAVENGDVLVTDMYLPREVILRMLDKVGLRKHFGLVISSSGKRSGAVWPNLKLLVEIEQHVGDHPHSDVKSPLASNVFAQHLGNSGLSPHELVYHQNGLVHLARAIRETRLGQISSHVGGEVNQQKLLQINCNIPILLLSCVHLKLLSAQIPFQKCLFSSRDCYHFNRLFQFLSRRCRWGLSSEYFYTSRLCRLNPSETYLRYFKEIASERSLVVDLCGTGWSLKHLYDRAGVTPHTFLIHDLKQKQGMKDIYEDVRQGSGSIEAFSIVTEAELNNSLLEMLNYIDCGMTTDVLVLDGLSSIIPIFEHPNYPVNVQHIVENIQSTQDAFLEVLAKVDIEALVGEIEANSSKIVPMILALYQNLSSNMGSMGDSAAYHTRQDEKSMWKLKGR